MIDINYVNKMYNSFIIFLSIVITTLLALILKKLNKLRRNNGKRILDNK